MRIVIKEVAKELKDCFVRIGGTVKNYEGSDEVIEVTLEHHSLMTTGDSVLIIDDLTMKKVILDRSDYYTVTIL